MNALIRHEIAGIVNTLRACLYFDKQGWPMSEAELRDALLYHVAKLRKVRLAKECDALFLPGVSQERDQSLADS